MACCLRSFWKPIALVRALQARPTKKVEGGQTQGGRGGSTVDQSNTHKITHVVHPVPPALAHHAPVHRQRLRLRQRRSCFRHFPFSTRPFSRSLSIRKRHRRRPGGRTVRRPQRAERREAKDAGDSLSNASSAGGSGGVGRRKREGEISALRVVRACCCAWYASTAAQLSSAYPPRSSWRTRYNGQPSAHWR